MTLVYSKINIDREHAHLKVMSLKSFLVILVNCVKKKKKSLTYHVLIFLYNKSYVDRGHARLKVMSL